MKVDDIFIIFDDDTLNTRVQNNDFQRPDCHCTKCMRNHVATTNICLIIFVLSCRASLNGIAQKYIKGLKMFDFKKKNTLLFALI